MVRYGQGLRVCRRQVKGKRCGGMNPPRAKKCARCEKPLPAKRKAKHMSALAIEYEEYIRLNGGEHCAICLREPGSRRLDRDHDHKTGKPRGLLCPRCNRGLPHWVTSRWLRDAADYLDERDPTLREIPF